MKAKPKAPHPDPLLFGEEREKGNAFLGSSRFMAGEQFQKKQGASRTS